MLYLSSGCVYKWDNRPARSLGHTARVQRLIHVGRNLRVLSVLWFVKASESNSEITVISSLYGFRSFLGYKYSEGWISCESDLWVWLTLGSPITITETHPLLCTGNIGNDIRNMSQSAAATCKTLYGLLIECLLKLR